MSTGDLVRIVARTLTALTFLVAAAPAAAQVSLGGYISSFGSFGSGPGQFNSPSAMAVDPADGSVYVADSGNNRVEKFNSAGVFQSQLGCASGTCPNGTGPGQFHFPLGVAVDPSDGSVYVTDALGGRVEKFSRSGTFLSQFGSAGSGNGQFSQPTGLAVDPTDGSVYVADTGNSRVEKFDAAGNYVLQFGSNGSANGQFSAPRGIAVDPADRRVYVVDNNENRVDRFSPSGAYLSQLGCAAGACGQLSGPGQFNLPSGVAVDPSDGAVLVADDTNRRVELFNASGTYQAQYGGSGSGPGQFSQPESVAFDPRDGSFYAIDLSGRVEHFRWPGAFVTTFGSSGTGAGQFDFPEAAAVLPTDRSVLVSDSHGNRVERFSSDGTLLSEIGCPTSAACDPGTAGGVFDNPLEIAATPSSIFVTDWANDRFEQFDTSGTFQHAFGSAGSGSGQFNSPVGIAVNPGGTLYVVDAGGNRVEEWQSGSEVTQLGCSPFNACSASSSEGGFSSPTSVAIDPSDSSVYVSDYNNNRVEKFNLNGTFLYQLGCATGKCATGSGPGQFSTPTRLAVDPSDGSLYVADTGNSRIERFSSTGAYQGEFGMAGSGLGQFGTPRGIAVDPIDGTVYVVDYTGDDVQELGLPAAPVCGPVTVSVPEVTAAPVSLDCTAPSGFHPFFTITAGPTHGTVSALNPFAGTFTYTPATGFAGSDSLTLSADDPGGSATETVSITVNPPPTCRGQTATTPAGKAVSVTLSCTDAAGAPVSYAIVSRPAHGSLSAIAQTGKVTYTPGPDFTGTDRFTYHGTSGNGTSATATVSITVTSATVSGVSLSGVAKRRPRLAFTAKAAAGGAPIKRITVGLPSGLSFAASKRTLAHNIKVGHGAFTATLSHGRLTITLAKPAGTASITIAAPALKASAGLAAKVKHHKAGRLKLTFSLTDTASHTTTLTPLVAPR
jgi:DNA-binding beta-propeller fold protein YncE